MRRVSTRDFLRNINEMREPVQVFSRTRLKGTWLPGDMTWPSDPQPFVAAIPVSDPMKMHLDAVLAGRAKPAAFTGDAAIVDLQEDIETYPPLVPMPMKARKAIRKGATYEG